MEHHMHQGARSKNGIGTGQRVWATIMVFAAIGAFVMQKPPASIFSGCGCLLHAWSLVYYPAPGFNSTVGDIYRSSRRGAWFTPKYARLVMLLGTILMVAGTLFQFNR
jgi:hypothetical protein